MQTPDGQNSTPGAGIDVSPNTALLDQRIDSALDKRGIAAAGGGGHMGGMSIDDQRLAKLEHDVSTIKGSLDWAKVAFALLCAVTTGGITLMVSLTMTLSGKVDGISNKISDEFRSQRLEQASEVSAISNAIVATKQQPPQVLLVPAPAMAPTGKSGAN